MQSSQLALPNSMAKRNLCYDIFMILCKINVTSLLHNIANLLDRGRVVSLSTLKVGHTVANDAQWSRASHSDGHWRK